MTEWPCAMPLGGIDIIHRSLVGLSSEWNICLINLPFTFPIHVQARKAHIRERYLY